MESAHSRTRFGVFELDLEPVSCGSPGSFSSPPQPFKVLALLASRPAQLVTREKLREQIWGTDTFVDFEHGLNFAIKKIRDTLGDYPQTPRYIETLPRRGYRFIAPVDGAAAGSPHASATLCGGWRRALPWGVAALLIVALAAGTYFYFHRAPKLTEKDLIVLADFTNTTGDPVFDGTLRQGLSVQLEQTPFLKIVSGDQVAQTLKMMERPPDATVDASHGARSLPAQQRDGRNRRIDCRLRKSVCVGLNAVNCANGETLAREQVTAPGKERVLPALGGAASELRSELGESRASLKTYNVPLEQATTPSLEALGAYSQACRRPGRGISSLRSPLASRRYRPISPRGTRGRRHDNLWGLQRSRRP